MGDAAGGRQVSATKDAVIADLNARRAMRRIVIDASVPHAKAKIGREGDTFVLAFPDHGVEIVFIDSKGSIYGAATLAGGIGMVLYERASMITRGLLAAAEAAAGENGRPN